MTTIVIISLIVIIMAAIVIIVAIYPFKLINNTDKSLTYTNSSHDDEKIVKSAIFDVLNTPATIHAKYLSLDQYITHYNQYNLEVFIDNVYVGNAIPGTSSFTFNLMILATQELSFTLGRIDGGDFKIQQPEATFTLGYTGSTTF
jgi:hypothetical protein